jgi:hypothetical protein
VRHQHRTHPAVDGLLPPERHDGAAAAAVQACDQPPADERDEEPDESDQQPDEGEARTVPSHVAQGEPQVILRLRRDLPHVLSASYRQSVGIPSPGAP